MATSSEDERLGNQGVLFFLFLFSFLFFRKGASACGARVIFLLFVGKLHSPCTSDYQSYCQFTYEPWLGVQDQEKMGIEQTSRTPGYNRNYFRGSEHISPRDCSAQARYTKVQSHSFQHKQSAVNIPSIDQILVASASHPSHRQRVWAQGTPSLGSLRRLDNRFRVSVWLCLLVSCCLGLV